MTSIIFAPAAGVVLPPNQRANWSRFGCEWDAWDGSHWDFRDVSSGVFITTEGLLGLHFPAWDPVTSSSPAVAGRRRLGINVHERTMRIPLYVCDDDGSREWLFLYQRLMQSFHPEKPGRLTITTPLGSRWIELYLDSGGDLQYERDPVIDGFARFPMGVTAEDPWWRGQPISKSWNKIEPVPFFGDDGSLHVSEGVQLESAQMSNPGNVDAWPVWQVDAHADPVDASIIVDGGELGLPTVPANGNLTIDTDPAVGSAELNGVDVDGLIDPWDPRPIEPGQLLPLNLAIAGTTGGISATIVPRYWLGL